MSDKVNAMQLFRIRNKGNGKNDCLIPAVSSEQALANFRCFYAEDGYIVEILGKYTNGVFALPQLPMCF